MDVIKEIRDFFNENPRMLFVVALAAVVAVAAGWWVYSGSGVQVNQFFAADLSDPKQCFYWDAGGNGDGNFSEMNGQIIPGVQNYHKLSYQGHYKNDCDYPVHLLFEGLGSNTAKTYSIKKSDFDPGEAFTRSPIDIAPHVSGIWKFTYNVDARDCGSVGSLAAWRFKDFPGSPPDIGVYAVAFSYNKSCGGPTPVPVTPVPVVSPVVCAPQNQTVAVGQSAYIQATGGTGVYTWTTSGEGVQQDGGSIFVAYSYQVPGNKSITVQSGGNLALCTVTVQGSPSVNPTNTISPTNTPSVSTGTGALLVQKMGLNIDRGDTTSSERVIASGGQTVQFVITVTSNTTQPLNNVVVRDTVPTGMTYQSGSTYVDGVRTSSDAIIAQGLPVGILPAGTSFTVRWSARVNPIVTSLPEQRPSALLSADNVFAVSDEVILNIVAGGSVGTGNPGGGTGVGTGSGGAGGVQTGPGDAVTLAFLISAAVTLLYTAYTRSPGFKSKEVEKISRDQGPLDFRG